MKESNSNDSHMPLFKLRDLKTMKEHFKEPKQKDEDHEVEIDLQMGQYVDTEEVINHSNLKKVSKNKAMTEVME